jgi:hypothetical protein
LVVKIIVTARPRHVACFERPGRPLREAATNLVEVNRGATETGSASGEVLNSAKALSSESTRLRAELLPAESRAISRRSSRES